MAARAVTAGATGHSHTTLKCLSLDNGPPMVFWGPAPPGPLRGDHSLPLKPFTRALSLSHQALSYLGQKSAPRSRPRAPPLPLTPCGALAASSPPPLPHLPPSPSRVAPSRQSPQRQPHPRPLVFATDSSASLHPRARPLLHPPCPLALLPCLVLRPGLAALEEALSRPCRPPPPPPEKGNFCECGGDRLRPQSPGPNAALPLSQCCREVGAQTQAQGPRDAGWPGTTQLPPMLRSGLPAAPPPEHPHALASGPVTAGERPLLGLPFFPVKGEGKECNDPKRWNSLSVSFGGSRDAEHMPPGR